MESPPVRRINVFSKQIKKSKYFKVIEIFYKILHIFCFLDFGFFEFRSYKLRIFWKFITIIQAMTFFSVCILTPDLQNNLLEYIMYYFCFFCYFFNVLGLVLINPNNTFYKLFIDLESIDYKLRIDNASYKLEIKILATCFLCFGFRAFQIIYAVFCVHYKLPSSLELLSIWSVTCLHFVLVSYSFAFFSINCRLKELVSILRTTSSDISSLKLVYKRIVELTESHKTAFDPIFVFGLLLGIPHIMLSLFEAVQSFFDNNITEISREMGFKYFIAANALILLFAPAICAGMLATQADRIRIVLHDKLLQVRDASRVREIEKFIGYVEARGCRFRVYKVIPLDADLPGMVLGFCVTYLIVIVQFTNK